MFNVTEEKFHSQYWQSDILLYSSSLTTYKSQNQSERLAHCNSSEKSTIAAMLHLTRLQNLLKAVSRFYWVLKRHIFWKLPLNSGECKALLISPPNMYHQLDFSTYQRKENQPTFTSILGLFLTSLSWQTLTRRRLLNTSYYRRGSIWCT